MVSTKDLRILFLYEFKLGHNAAVASRNINAAFGAGSASQRTIRFWFEKFRSGNMNLENEPRGRPKTIVNEGHLRNMVEANPHRTVRTLACDLSVSVMTVSRHLAAIGKVKRLDKWVPHELIDGQKLKRLEECIKPVKIEKTATSTGSKITIQEDGSYFNMEEDGKAQRLQKVEITLADCLACSGCITSAESVLVTQQSQEELLKVFNNNKNLLQAGKFSETNYIVVSLSVQPILSLANHYNLTPTDAAYHLVGYFKQLGADMVIDMNIADDFALLENQREFVKRYRAAEIDGSKNSLPMLASSCPGWICYAEKTHGSYILPYISCIKSPQQIIGSLVKDYVMDTFAAGRAVYHVTVMPCYDKKLEASREDFFNTQTQNRDVDCVITAIEIEQMLQNEGISLGDVPSSNFSNPWSKISKEHRQPSLWAHEGTGSGGYADHIFKYAAKELFGEDCAKLQYKNLRNPDFREAVLEKDGKVVLRFAIANGFRNIQNLVQKLKRGKSLYHYIEVMACPSGCLNGGAQVRPLGDKTIRELTNELETTYAQLPTRQPEDNEIIKELYDSWLGGADSDKCVKILHTQYHAVEKLNTALNIKW